MVMGQGAGMGEAPNAFEFKPDKRWFRLKAYPPTK